LNVVQEPLRGWRGWQVVDGRDGPCLASWWVGTLWPAQRPLEARCALHGSRPAARHTCGVHAFTARDEALAYIESSHGGVPLLFARQPRRALGVVVGRVSGWGRAVVHRRGWRSEYAYPYDLYLLRGDRGLARLLAGLYAVDVLPFPP
jgi:hypothetical protein